MIRQVLTVCIGNVCRSPVAQLLLARALPGLEVRSAGLRAYAGQPVDKKMQRLLAAEGLDGSALRAERLAEWMLRQSDLVLVMEADHRTEIEGLYPLSRGRVFRLGHFDQQDIVDPIGKDGAVFQRVYQQINAGVGHWAERIRKLGYEQSA
ncbi:MAG: hypothetical protein RLZZ393_1382 [Pseudomonadota bacterium]